MKRGGSRAILVPPALAYGKKGVPDSGKDGIPPNATLYFELDLL